MHESFDVIDPERKKRILDAAFSEFARHGYKKASTNRIVEAAGIGKGPLFSYFGCKAGLFEYLLEYAGEFVNRYLVMADGLTLENDFLKRYRLASKLKFEMNLKEPCMFDFLAWLYLQENELLEIEELKDMSEKYIINLKSFRSKFMLKFSKNPDLSKLRGDISAERLVEYVGWIMEGYINQLVNRLKSYPVLSEMSLDPYWKEFDELINDLEKVFYKPHSELSGNANRESAKNSAENV